MTNIAKQSTNLPPGYNLDVEGRRSTWDKMYLGYVRDIADRAYMGRIKVWIPELSGPDRQENWILVDYASPFGGSSPISSGSTKSEKGSQKSYGFFMLPPDNDNQVICGFINGDPNKGFWFACMFQQNQTGMVPSTPGNSPSRENASKFSSIITPSVMGATGLNNITTESSPEQATEGFAADRSVGTLDPTQAAVGMNEWGPVGENQRAANTANDPVVGPSTYSAGNSYNVNGISTPGGNRFIMSDQDGDTQIRLATRDNAQLILHNHTGLIVLMTGDGKSRVELHRDGNIDIYGEGHISLHSSEDINLHADNNLNLSAGNFVQIHSDGDTKMYSRSNINLFSNENMRITSMGEQHRYSNGNLFDTSAQRMHRKSNYGINDSVVEGKIDIRARGSVRITASADGNIDLLTLNKFNVQSKDSANIKSDKAISLLSKENLNLKSSDGQARLQAKNQVHTKSNLVFIDGSKTYIKGEPVFIGPSTVINVKVAAAEDAASAGEADTADTAKKAVEASQPYMREHMDRVVAPGFPSGLAGHGSSGGAAGIEGRSQHIVNTPGSRLPGAEPSLVRFQASPGYSNADIVERDELEGKDFKIGQIEASQSVPLQVIGWKGSGNIIKAGDLSEAIKLAINAVVSFGVPYPTTRQLVRPEDIGSQHALGTAADFSLRNVPVATRQAIVQAVVNDVKSGTGPFRFIRGIGTYDTQCNILHLDARSSGWTRWGPNWSYTSLPETPAWFSSLVYDVTPAKKVEPLPETTSASQTSGSSSAEEPKRYIGQNYQGSTPQYTVEEIPKSGLKTAGEWSLSEVGLQDIKNFETLRGPRPSDMPNKQFTAICGDTVLIGYGHKLSQSEIESGQLTTPKGTVTLEQGINEEQATALLKQDVASAESAVKSAITVKITQHQYDALVDFCWNIGAKKFQDSDVVKKVNSQKFDEVPNEMIKWIRACGVRKAELQARRQFNATRFAGAMRASSPASVGGVGAPRGPSAPPASINGDRVKTAYCYFLKIFGSPAVAAGLVGNLLAENSSLDPNLAQYGGGPGFGLAQWEEARQRVFAQWYGKPLKGSTFEEQLKFIADELTNSGFAKAEKRLRSVDPTDWSSAADIINMYYEVSRDGIALQNGVAQGSTFTRRNNARDVYNKFAGQGNPCGN